MTPQYLLKPARLAGSRLLQTQSDERLLDLVRNGSEPAFETIVARYRPQLLRYCARLLSADRAEDVVQQAFANAYGAIRRSERDVQLRPWLYRIAHNAALRVLRDRKLRYEELDEGHDGVDTPVQALDRRERLREVVAAIQTLPERQREAILLREIEGRSYDEIATELGVNPGAVRQLLNRARNALRATATALTPPAFLIRLHGSSPRAGRAAEVGAELGLGSIAAKASATLLVAGAAITSVAPGPIPGLGGGDDDGESHSPAPEAVTREVAPRSGGFAHPATASLGTGRDESESRRADDAEQAGSGSADGSTHPGSGGYYPGSGSGSSGSGSGGYPDNSGPGSYSSGSGSGSGGYPDNSGPGSYSSGSGSGSSGSGSGGHPDNSGPGSYSSGSGSGSSGSGSGGNPDNSGPGSFSSGSGSGSSGSATSASAYASGSGSGSSGSGSSGSGSSGSGSGESGSGGSGSGE